MLLTEHTSPSIRGRHIRPLVLNWCDLVRHQRETLLDFVGLLIFGCAENSLMT